MAKASYEYCPIRVIRRQVEAQLDLGLSKARRREEETATEFWARVERMGRLVEALALYDQLAAAAARARVRRETKKEFAERVEREGRRAEAERLQGELSASGRPQRQVQEELVARLQPLDGSETRCWQTPDPWMAGRLFRSKKDEEQVLAQVESSYDDPIKDEARKRLTWAKARLEERQALASARIRARALKTPAPAAETPGQLGSCNAPA